MIKLAISIYLRIGTMTDFQTLVKNKLSSNFKEEKLKEAEALTNMVFLANDREGPSAVKDLILTQLQDIIKNSGVDISELESLINEKKV
jgi:hypothetical protein